MTLLVDAGVVVAMHDRRDRMQEAAEACLRAERGLLVLPAPVSAEIDSLLSRRGGPGTRRGFLADLAAGRYSVECLRPEDYATVAELERTYADLSPGLADLSIVLLAERHATGRVATFDERHFRSLRRLSGGAFTLLPADG